MQHLYSHRNSALFSYFPSFRTNTLYISRIFTTYTLYIFNVLACIPIIRLLFRPQPLCCLAISMTCGIFSPNALFLVNCPIIWSLLCCVCACMVVDSCSCVLCSAFQADFYLFTTVIVHYIIPKQMLGDLQVSQTLHAH